MLIPDMDVIYALNLDGFTNCGVEFRNYRQFGSRFFGGGFTLVIGGLSVERACPTLVTKLSQIS